MTTDKYRFLVFYLVILGAFFSCEPEDNEKSMDRVAFYFAGLDEDCSDSDYGLFRYYLNEDFEERVAVYPVEATTCLADNGKVLFEYDEGVNNKLWKKCLFGALMEIPLPPSDDNGNYSYSDRSCLAMSGDGYHLCYFAKFSHNGSSNYRLIYFHWCDREIIIPDLKEFLIDKYPEYSIDGFIPSGKEMIMNYDGSCFYFSITATSQGNPVTNLLLKYSYNKFSVINESDSNIMEIVGYDKINDNVIYKENSSIFRASSTNGVSLLEINEALIKSNRQFARKKSQLVVFDNEFIRLLSSEDGSIIKDVVSFDEIIGIHPNFEKKDTEKLSISPSGDYIIFALERINSDKRYGLFTIRADGTELMLIKDNIALNNVLISDHIEVQR